MLEMPYETLFSLNMVDSRYPDFPYPEKFCAYCNKNMTLVKTYHIIDSPHDFKGIYICYNQSCDAYDEPAERAYVRVYYSSPKAAFTLDRVRSRIDQPEKK